MITLEDALSLHANPQDGPAGRRSVLLRLIWQESYLSRDGLKASVEAVLGRGCYGARWQRAFQRDIAVVRSVLATAGYRLAYDRHRRGYHILGRPPLDEDLQQLIAGAAAEVDPRQIAIYRRLTPAQRMRQLAHLSDWLRRAERRRRERADA